MMPDSLSAVVVTALKLMVALCALSIGAALLWLGWLLRRVTVEDAQAWEQARIAALPAPLDTEDAPVIVLAVPPLTLDELREMAYEPVAESEIVVQPSEPRPDMSAFAPWEREVLDIRRRHWLMVPARQH